MRVRKVLALGLSMLMLAAAGTARAQEYPNRPVRIVVPYAPGGVTDNSVRVLVDKLSARLGQQVVVENRPGAAGNLGTHQVSQAAPDGYTLVLGFDGNFCINPHTYKSLPFDPLKDFAPVTKLGDATIVLVAGTGVPANNLSELIKLSKDKPGYLSFGSAGTGQTSHVVGELIKIQTGLDMVHVPYKGGGPALVDVVGGQIPLVMTYIAGANQYIKQGRVKPIGVVGSKRDPSLPDVPTFGEQGANVDATSWVGILAPAKTPRPIVERLQRDIAAVLKEDEIRQRYATLGIIPVGNTPDQFAEQIRADYARWEPVVKKAGIKVD